jgi:hypothetical protein
MKTIFDKTTSDELIARINKLDENSKPQWGSMTVYQMLKHNTLWEDLISGKTKFKRNFPGRLFGKPVLKALLKDDSPLRRNTPTIPQLKIRDDGNVSLEKEKWISMIRDHAAFSDKGIVHPFFGKMTKEEIGYLAYKHSDHHLRQFNC